MQAKKRFGQNFLHDGNIVNRIISSMSPGAADHFIEIGPGHGAITRPLSEAAGKLDVIEIDHELAAKLRNQAWAKDLAIHEGDALKFPFTDISTAENSLRLAGNLPYNISTPLLFHILEHQHLFIDVHVMLQKEVVQRMTAQPGNKIYGRLTVALAARCHVESLFIIKPGSFKPAPKIESAFARLTPLAKPLIEPSEAPLFDTIIRNAFGQRRKQLGNALKDVITPEQFSSAGIRPDLRAEKLSVEEFVALTRAAM